MSDRHRRDEQGPGPSKSGARPRSLRTPRLAPSVVADFHPARSISWKETGLARRFAAPKGNPASFRPPSQGFAGTCREPRIFLGGSTLYRHPAPPKARPLLSSRARDPISGEPRPARHRRRPSRASPWDDSDTVS